MKKVMSVILSLALCLTMAMPAFAEQPIPPSTNELEIVPYAYTDLIDETYSTFEITRLGIAQMDADMTATSSSNHTVKSTKVVANLMQDGKTIKTFSSSKNNGFASIAADWAVEKGHNYQVKYVFYAYATDGFSENITVYSNGIYY